MHRILRPDHHADPRANPFNDLTWPQNELFVPSTDVRNVSAPLVQRENDRVHRLTIDGQDWNDRYPFF
jgi:hypothetical protein